MYRRIRFLLIMSCLAFFLQANAQFDDPKTIEVGPHVGLSYYMGDLNPTIPFAQAQLQYGGVVRFNWDNRWTFRFDYSRATVKADDAVIKWRPERGLNFTTKINDFSLEAEFNFLEYYTGNPKRNVSPYIFGGFSVFQYTPYAEVAGTLLNLRDYDTETPLGNDAKWYEKLTDKSMPVGFSIPFGVGVKFSLSRHMAATVEWRMQKTFTDYLDDVCGTYPEKSALYEIENNVIGNDGIDYGQSSVMIYNLSDPSDSPLIVGYIQRVNGSWERNYPKDDQGNKITKPGRYLHGQQRGNSAFNDWFGMARVSLTWKFNLPDKRGCNLSKF